VWLRSECEKSKEDSLCTQSYDQHWTCTIPVLDFEKCTDNYNGCTKTRDDRCNFSVKPSLKTTFLLRHWSKKIKREWEGLKVEKRKKGRCYSLSLVKAGLGTKTAQKFGQFDPKPDFLSL
jgi:hypothetical protein